MIIIFLHLGQDTVVNKKNIVGIFDMDTSTVSKHTRNFLNLAEKKGNVINVSYELPKSFVVCEEKGNKNVYISQLASTTLEKRVKSKKILSEI